MKKVHLIIIDPQRDFCTSTGSLYVPGADRDMQRVADMVDRIGAKLADIHVTLDQHHLLDVAHPLMWKGTDGKNPNPFTIISTSDVENGVWSCTIPSLTRRMIAYVRSLESGGRYPLCIWPPHCLIGSEGASLVECISCSLDKWVANNTALIDFVSKGSNIFTEHYSGVKAEVVDPEDPTTQLNTRLIRTLEEADEILVAGEAGSHCLANTVKDIVEGFSNAEYVRKITLLTDGTSPVPGFEDLQDQFIKDMTAKGMKISTTLDILS